MPRTIATVSLLVDDDDPAIRFYTQALRFGAVVALIELHGNRWNLIEPVKARP